MSSHSNIPNRHKLFQYWITVSIAVIVIFSLLAYKTNIFKLSDYTRATVLTAEGNSAYENEYWGDSNVSYLKASAVSPERSKIQFNLANTYYQQGRYDEARELYYKLLKEKNNALEPAIWNNLGNAWYMYGDIFQSFAAYKKSLLLNDKDAVVRQNFLFLNSKVQQFFRQKGTPTNKKKQGADNGSRQEDSNSNDQGPHEGLDDQELGKYKISDKEMDQLLTISKQKERVPQGTGKSGVHTRRSVKDGPDY